MNINYDNSGNFYARNPQINDQKKLQFEKGHCSHYLIISGNITEDFVLEGSTVEQELEGKKIGDIENSVIHHQGYKIKVVTHNVYATCGYIEIDPSDIRYMVYGCLYSANAETLSVSFPQKKADSYISVPMCAKCSINKVMTEAKNGFFGFGKKPAEFKNTYRVRISFDDVSLYVDGSIYYKLGDYMYQITRGLLNTEFFIKSKDIPEFFSNTTSIRLNMIN